MSNEFIILFLFLYFLFLLVDFKDFLTLWVNLTRLGVSQDCLDINMSTLDY